SEVPFGYGDKHLKDTTYQDILYTRARATVNRDKAHACVMVWSVGNENPFTEMERKTGKEVKKTDPTRPICFPQRGSTFRDLINKGYVFPADVDIYAPHYPTTEQLTQFYRTQDRPLLFTEYCHTLGTAFEDHDLQWEIIQNNEGMLGGSVWEWVDQGMPFQQPLRQRYGKEERVFTSKDGGFMMFGNKGTDGLLYANRVPLPNYYELQHNYAQAFVIDSLTRYDASTGQVSLTLCNRYDFSNLDGTNFQWAFTADDDTLATGHFSPNCPPRSQTTWQLNLPKLSVNDDRNPLLHVSITSPQGYRILQQVICLKPSTVTSRLLKTMASEGNPFDCLQLPLMVRAGRKSTLGEDIRRKSRLSRYLLPVSSDGMAGPDSCRIRADIKSETQQEALHVTFSLTPPAQHIFMPELGVALVLDKSLNCIQWIGKGPYATYPGRCQADRYGLWGLRRGDLYLEGNRMGVEAVWATDSIGNGVLIVCKDGNVNFEETDRGLVISVNGAVAGVGPKFQQTTHPVWADKVGTVSGQFWLYRTTSNKLPQSLKQLFINPSEMAKPFHPFETQYDTYPMRLADIMDRHGRP
ncbi:MAG: glycoside hydrolase family 2 TIM barrel-domain containing protein, partial [Prevotella sp.]